MRYKFNPPPNWPTPPNPNWRPPQGWTPPAEWGPLPQGWQLWTPVKRSIFAHPIVIVGYVIAGILSVAILGSLGGAPASTGHHVAASAQPTDEATTEPTEEETTEPTVTPSPDGTFSGSCDYELNGLYDYALTGEVEVENTGNVGIVVKVKITWPQYADSPIKMSKTVRVGYGKTKTVQFRRKATGSEIDRLQSWQERHDYDDGCKYHGSMLDTYGLVH